MRRDPEGHELSQLLRFGQVDGRRVLDLGCGDGDLTYRYAVRAGAVVGVDPDIADLRTARRQQPAPGVQFAAARGQALPLAAGQFDLVIFTSSL